MAAGASSHEAAMSSFVQARPGPRYGAFGSVPSSQVHAGLDWLDVLLVCVFLVGLYTNYTIQISAKVPFPSAPAGVAGLLLLWRRRQQITVAGFAGLIGVLFLYVVSVLCATDLGFLPRRTNGLIQLTYSITIGYALYLTIIQGDRRQVAALFLAFSLVIVIGCLLETYGGLRPLSDAVRKLIYNSKGVYENDLRDIIYYKQVRPKFFASEPASVTFCYVLFTFVWMVVSPWRHKLALYVVLVGVGLFAMPGPTLLLMLVLIFPYMLFLASRHEGRLDYVRAVGVFCIAMLFLGAFVVLGEVLFATRLKEATSGNDPSFFYRVQGPFLAAIDVARHYPLAGAGLTGEPFVEREVVNIYVGSPDYSARWEVVTPATELLINYFWLHWIYLGLFWGTVLVVAITVWLSVIGAMSPAFCWMVWAILGQASGAYVGPTCWAVLFLAAAATVLQQRSEGVDQWSRVPAMTALQARLSRQSIGNTRAEDRGSAGHILSG
jgi:hypothetical protein